VPWRGVLCAGVGVGVFVVCVGDKDVRQTDVPLKRSWRETESGTRHFHR
jgi:hypothetical protein